MIVRSVLYAAAGSFLFFGLNACVQSSDSGPAVLAHIETVTPLDDGGLMVHFDLRSDGRPLVFVIQVADDPRISVARVSVNEEGRDLRVFVSSSELGPWALDRRSLVVILSDEQGGVFARRRVF